VRVFGALSLVILFAAAAMMYLQQKDATTSLQAVAEAARDLRESGVEGRSFDRDLASEMVSSLRALLVSPEDLAGRTEELRAVAAEAASWAEAAPAPSVELRVAVALRSAAGELRAYSLRPTDRHLLAAEKHLDTAEAALAGEPVHNNPTDALRDQLENLQRSHQEQQLEVDEALEDF
jgi:predicted nucleic acid-binding protein